MSIETERLILRPFTESDAPALLTYLRTPAAHCFQDMKKPVPLHWNAARIPT